MVELAHGLLYPQKSVELTPNDRYETPPGLS